MLLKDLLCVYNCTAFVNSYNFSSKDTVCLLYNLLSVYTLHLHLGIATREV